MAKVDGSLGSLVQGVSQQPARARLAGQSEEQINVTNDEVFGLSRRPATVLKETANRAGLDTDNLRIMEYGSITHKDQLIDYALRVGVSPSITLFTETGIKIVGTNATDREYLATSTAESVYNNRIIFKEMNGKIYVLNTEKVVAKLDEKPDDKITNSTVIYTRGVEYATAYIVAVNIAGKTHSVAYTVVDGSQSGHVRFGTARYVMTILNYLLRNVPTGAGNNGDRTKPWVIRNFDNLQPTPANSYTSAGAAAAISSAFKIRMINDHILFEPIDPDLEYTITCTDTTGQNLFEDLKDEITDVDKLPTRTINGHCVRVAGTTNPEDDYFLQYTVEGISTGVFKNLKGVWIECTSPYEDYKLDPATMPHELVYDNDTDTWTIDPLEWNERGSGSDDSNPMPSFVGSTIQDIADFQGRAVYIHDGEVSMSRTDEYEHWFNQTATAVAASDPINVRSTSTEGDSQMVYAVPFNRDLILFGTANSQFMVSGRSVIKPDTASLLVTSQFDVSLKTRPRAVGDRILYTSYSGKYTQLHEMYLLGDQESHARRTNTDHVPRYMLGEATVLGAADGVNSAGVICSDRRTVYVYEYLWIDNKRVQSSWSKWHMPCDVMSFAFNEGSINIIMITEEGAIYTADMKTYRKDASNLPFPVYTDLQIEVDLNDTNTFTVPYSGTDDPIVVSLEGRGLGNSLVITSTEVPITPVGHPEQLTVTLSQNHTGKVLFGQRYNTRFIPTMPYLKDGDGVAVTGAKLSISDFVVTYENSGPFIMTRQSLYEAPEDYWSLRYSGRTLGDPDFKIGGVPIDSGKIEFPFSDDSSLSRLLIECDSHLPMTLTEIEWRGDLRNRSRRITQGG